MAVADTLPGPTAQEHQLLQGYQAHSTDIPFIF